MATTFDTTAWLLQTFLILVGMLAALPVLRAAAGLALVLITRGLGRERGRLHAYGLSLLPKFARAVLTAGVGIGSLTGPVQAQAVPVEPQLVLDRVIDFPASPPRFEVGAERPTPATASHMYRVSAGDSLWSIAKAELSRQDRVPSNLEIDAAWRRLWLENLQVVGNDPSLIHPGQRLRIPGDLSES